MAEWPASPPTASTRRDTPLVGLTVLAFACLITATFLVGEWWKLGVLLAISVAWMGRGAGRSATRRAGTWGWIAAGVGALAFLLGSVGLPVTQYAGPVVRLAILVMAGRAFALSTSVAEWRRALWRARLPNRMVLLFAAAHAMTGMLASEVRLAREGMRIRAACVPRKRSPLGPARAWWRAGVAFLARLFIRADLMAVAAETRGFGRPGTRAAAQASRLRAADVVTAVFCIGSAAVLCLV